jgi:3-hydroxyisobutyrate dehydrogenase-like beta-hydroxyacid dehydrogenase
MRVGFVGAGRMGRPMVERLVAAKHEVSVLGRSPEACDSLRAAGAFPVDDVVAVGVDAAAVCVCVFSDDQVRAVCLDTGLLEVMPVGAVLVVHTTGSPATVAAIAAVAEPRGVGVLDCPVSGGPHDIAAGRVTLFAGGSPEHTERVRPILQAYGDPLLHVGPLGAGQGVKLVNNAVFAANIGLLAEAVRLGSRLGVAEDVLLTALTHGSATSRALTAAAGRGSVAAFGSARTWPSCARPPPNWTWTWGRSTRRSACSPGRSSPLIWVSPVPPAAAPACAPRFPRCAAR